MRSANHLWAVGEKPGTGLEDEAHLLNGSSLMIPIVVFWTNYTATVRGRVLKLVPCESCKAEYVYVLEREGVGAGTSVYGLYAETAQDNAESGAQEVLDQYLANDFDPIPCPMCGHY